MEQYMTNITTNKPLHYQCNVGIKTVSYYVCILCYIMWMYIIWRLSARLERSQTLNKYITVVWKIYI